MDITENMKCSYTEGDYVMYDGIGICRINDIRKEKFCGMDEKLYYVMSSVYDEKAKFYLPADSPLASEKLRRLLTADEIYGIIDKTENEDIAWIDNDELRTQKFDDILKSRDVSKILWLVKILHLHKERMKNEKKKFRTCDEKTLAAAERFITEEFAFVIGVKKEKVIRFIVDYIKSKDNTQTKSAD